MYRLTVYSLNVQDWVSPAVNRCTHDAEIAKWPLQRWYEGLLYVLERDVKYFGVDYGIVSVVAKGVSPSNASNPSTSELNSQYNMNTTAAANTLPIIVVLGCSVLTRVF